MRDLINLFIAGLDRGARDAAWGPCRGDGITPLGDKGAPLTPMDPPPVDPPPVDPPMDSVVSTLAPMSTVS